MGIISVIAFAIGLMLLIMFSSGLRYTSKDFDKDDPERAFYTWASRACLLVLFLATVGIVDSYIYKLPNPFAGPKVGNELPQSSPPPPTPSEPDIRADDLRPDMDEVKKEHRDQLKEFERGPSPAERTDP